MSEQRLTPEMLERLKELHRQATPGTWEVYDANEGDFPPRPLWCVANDEYHNPTDDDAPAVDISVNMGCKADADFSAEAHNTLPLLLSEIEHLQALLGEYRDALSPFVRLYEAFLRESCHGNIVDVPTEMPLLVNDTQWLVNVKGFQNAKTLIEKGDSLSPTPTKED